MATAQGRNGWLRAARQSLDRHRARQARSIKRSRSIGLLEARRRLEEELEAERIGNERYEAYRARGRMKNGRRFGVPPKPYAPPNVPRGEGQPHRPRLAAGAWDARLGQAAAFESQPADCDVPRPASRQSRACRPALKGSRRSRSTVPSSPTGSGARVRLWCSCTATSATCAPGSGSSTRSEPRTGRSPTAAGTPARTTTSSRAPTTRCSRTSTTSSPSCGRSKPPRRTWSRTRGVGSSACWPRSTIPRSCARSCSRSRRC